MTCQETTELMESMSHRRHGGVMASMRAERFAVRKHMDECQLCYRKLIEEAKQAVSKMTPAQRDEYARLMIAGSAMAFVDDHTGDCEGHPHA